MCVIYAGGVRRRREGNKAMMLGQKLTDFTFDQKGKKRFGKCFNSIKRRENRELGLCVYVELENSLSWWKNHYISSNWKWDEVHRKLFSSCTHFALYKHESSAYGKRLCEFSVGKLFTVRKFSPKKPPKHIREFEANFPFISQASSRKIQSEDVEREVFQTFSLRASTEKFTVPSSILCRHTDERKKKSSNISRVVVEFSRREKQERPGEILKINLIIAIAITESVASHRIFLPVQLTHPSACFEPLSLFSGPVGSRERAPHPLKISSSSPTLWSS